MAEPTCLLPVCETLVLKALEQVGKRIVRDERSRFRNLDGPFYLAHTRWRPDPTSVARSLSSAWDLAPALLGTDAPAVVAMLDEYVGDLLITGTPHTTAELSYRISTRLCRDPETAALCP